MKTAHIGIVIGAVLFLTAPSIAGAGSPTPSVLSRLRVVEDPELGELIRAAIDNYRREARPRSTREGELSVTRQVTESYARIKLLDRQIELLGDRVRAVGEPEELRYELILARAELESERTMELANLRQIIGVMPDYPLGSKPAWRLKTWLRLDVIGNRVYVTKARQPFHDRTEWTSFAPGKLMTRAGAMQSIKERLSQEDALPIRIDIFRNAEGVTLSQDIERSVIELIHEAGTEMQAEVHLDASARQAPSELAFYLERYRIATDIDRIVNQNHFPRVELDDFIEPNDMGEYLREQLLDPGTLPAKIEITHNPGDAEFATQVTERIRQTVQDLDLAECIEIERTAEELDPARRYLGRWEAQHEGETLTIHVQERSKGLISEGYERESRTAWWIDDGKIGFRVGFPPGTRGHINPEGNLVIKSPEEEPVVFERVD